MAGDGKEKEGTGKREKAIRRYKEESAKRKIKTKANR